MSPGNSDEPMEVTMAGPACWAEHSLELSALLQLIAQSR
jgi:hypothetical protein